jgi:hypothetical protein
VLFERGPEHLHFGIFDGNQAQFAATLDHAQNHVFLIFLNLS